MTKHDAVREREAFDLWAKKNGFGQSQPATWAWEAWQARAAIASRDVEIEVIVGQVNARNRQIEELRAELAKLRQGEPVAGAVWGLCGEDGVCLIQRGTEDARIAKHGGSRLYKAPPPAQPTQAEQSCHDPHENGSCRHWPFTCEAKGHECVAAAHPPREPVQPLSDEDINGAISSQFDTLLDHIYEYGTMSEGIRPRMLDLCRAIERLITERMSAGETK